MAGSIGTVLYLMVKKLLQKQDCRLSVALLKGILWLYVLPVGFAAVVLSRTMFTKYGIRWYGDFGYSTSPAVTNLFMILGWCWLAGLGVGVLIRLVEYRKLRKCLAGNIPVEEAWYDPILEEYRVRYGLPQVELYQNDLLRDAITTGIWRPQIVLPYCVYEEKQLHMVLAHEMVHIQKRDLLWKKMALFVTWLHWWNPLAYVVLHQLAGAQELECDVIACQNSDTYTMADYILFLADMEENPGMVFASAISGSKKLFFRRVENMKQSRKLKPMKSVSMVLCCLVLVVCSTVPAYAATNEGAKLYDRWMESTEIEIELEKVDYSSEDNVITEIDKGDVVEVEAPQNGEMVGSKDSRILDATIVAKESRLYEYRTMQVGDQMIIVTTCDDRNVNYRVGIKNLSTNKVKYIEGSGILVQELTITEAGAYCVYVENCSNVAMEVVGSAIYLE